MGRPHAISSTDEYLSLVLDALEGIRELLDERLPAPVPPPAEPKLATGAAARVVHVPALPDPAATPVDIKEPAPTGAARKRPAKKTTPATTPEE